MRTDPLAKLRATIIECVQKVAPHLSADEIKIARCRDPKRGDYTTNAALVATKRKQ